MTAESPQEYAKRRVEELRKQPIMGVRYLNKDDAERYAGQHMAVGLAAGLIDPAKAVAAAKDGDPLFQHALGLLGLAERPKRLQMRRRRETNFFRDIAITMLVQEIVEGFQVKATASSKSGHSGCACGIVADALDMNYDAVCAVWKRLGKQI